MNKVLCLTIVLYLVGISSECYGQKHFTLNTYGGYAYFSDQDLSGLSINIDVTYPVNHWIKMGIGISNANAHDIHEFGNVVEKQYITTYNALIIKAFFIPVNTNKHSLDLGLGGLYHYTGFSYFLYREVRSVDSNETYLIKEFYSSGKRGPNFVLSARYNYHLKTKRHYIGCQYDYHNYSALHCVSFVFGVGL